MASNDKPFETVAYFNVSSDVDDTSKLTYFVIARLSQSRTLFSLKNLPYMKIVLKANIWCRDMDGRTIGY